MLIALVVLRAPRAARRRRPGGAGRSRRVVLLVVTCGPHVASVPSSATSCIARWVMKVVGPAPCQCTSLASKRTVSPARSGWTGSPRDLEEPGALGDVERLAERVRVPGGAGAGREVHAEQLHVRAGRDLVDVDVAGEPLRPARAWCRAGGG